MNLNKFAFYSFICWVIVLNMFRKLMHISISILLLTVTAGFSISKHYCGPRLVSVSVNHEAESCCDMEGTSNCCHNETKSFQLDEDFTTSSVYQNDSLKSIDLFIVNLIITDLHSVSEDYQQVFVPESPPPKDTQTVLSRLQSYLC